MKRARYLTGYKYYLRHISKKSLGYEFIHVSIYDVLDNRGMNKLIRSLTALKRKKQYKIDTHYFSYRFKELNYINSNIDRQSTGIVGEIKLLNDKWIDIIDISYTNLNNSQVIIQYNFRFKKIMSTLVDNHNFIMDNILHTKKEFYFHSYANKKIIKNAKYHDLLQLDYIFFGDILQDYICKLFYTNYGKKYKLPLEFAYRIKNFTKKKSKKLESSIWYESYSRKNEHLLIDSIIFDRYEISYYIHDRFLPNTKMLKYFSEYSTEFYYKVFYNIEINELESHMRKYLNSKKSFISSNDIKWLVNKIKYIKDQKDKITRSLSSKNHDRINNLVGWQNKKKKTELIKFPEYTDYFENLYKQNLEYLQAISSVQNDTLIIIISIITLIVSFSGIIISLLNE